jgi:hypothetical protein
MTQEETVKRKSANEWAEAYLDPSNNDKCAVIIAMAMAQARRDALQEAADIVGQYHLVSSAADNAQPAERVLPRVQEQILALRARQGSE